MEKRGMMKRFLAESLKELMLQKSFEKITIKQICDKTGVIRATFYNYFEDKYAALSYIIYLDTVETALPYICLLYTSSWCPGPRRSRHTGRNPAACTAVPRTR